MLLFHKGEQIKDMAGKRYEFSRNIYAAEACAVDDLMPLDGQDAFREGHQVPAWYWDALRKRFKEVGHVAFQTQT